MEKHEKVWKNIQKMEKPEKYEKTWKIMRKI